MRSFLTFIGAIVKGDDQAVAKQLAANPSLATSAYDNKGPSIFYKDITHYIYGGDTALHMAAATASLAIARLLVANGANVRAVNRRGAGPLHYAMDANWNAPAAQAAMIEFLISAGADPNAVDKSGVAPLHRAVRNRSAAAVRALLDGGANVNQRNRSGSTPLFLARHNTGKSGSGSPESRAQRVLIEALLEKRT